MKLEPITIVSIARTPIGKFQGMLKDIPAPELGALALSAVMERAHIKPNEIDEVLMGCVLPAGLGQAPARQAALNANIASHTPCTTINKVCGSGMKSIMQACDQLRLQSANIILAGGMENMSRAPYLMTKARSGYRLGHQTVYDHMMLDGLEDAYDKGKPMGFFADQAATQYQISRKQQDDFALQSFELAKKANQEKIFQFEIVPVQVQQQIFSQDEHPFSVPSEKIPSLKPVFVNNGTVTAGNSSAISDGAAAVALMPLQTADQRKIKPFAIINGYCSVAKSSNEFTSAPVLAIEKLLKQLNWNINDVDLFEINEAFAVVALIALQALKIPRDKLNIHGGAIALGHPIGASGARILVTLIGALKEKNLKRGIAAACIGGGEATAIAVELY